MTFVHHIMTFIDHETAMAFDIIPLFMILLFDKSLSYYMFCVCDKMYLVI